MQRSRKSRIYKRTAGRIGTILSLGLLGLFLLSAATPSGIARPIAQSGISDPVLRIRQQAADSYMEIYDLQGRRLFEVYGQIGERGVKSRVQRLPVGVYLARIVFTDGLGRVSVSVKKIVVLR